PAVPPPVVRPAGRVLHRRPARPPRRRGPLHAAGAPGGLRRGGDRRGRPHPSPVTVRAPAPGTGQGAGWPPGGPARESTSAPESAPAGGSVPDGEPAPGREPLPSPAAAAAVASRPLVHGRVR